MVIRSGGARSLVHQSYWSWRCRQGYLIQRRPLHACLTGRRDVLAGDALGQLQGPGNLLVREASLELEMQTFFDITHGY